MYKQIKYFSGLNELRFLAAFFVVLHHGETIRLKYGYHNFEWLSFFRNGTNAVNFFFVLSGFLISYLLLKEKHNTDNINVKQFYIKRILRIWPLYFLLFFIGTLLMPLLISYFNMPYDMPYTIGDVWAYFVFFFPGLVLFYFGHHFLEPLWSIGVEEVFYIIWAPIFKLFRNNLLFVLSTIMVLKIVLLIIAEIFLSPQNVVHYLLNIYSFELFAMGGGRCLFFV